MYKLLLCVCMWQLSLPFSRLRCKSPPQLVNNSTEAPGGPDMKHAVSDDSSSQLTDQHDTRTLETWVVRYSWLRPSLNRVNWGRSRWKLPQQLFSASVLMILCQMLCNRHKPLTKSEFRVCFWVRLWRSFVLSLRPVWHDSCVGGKLSGPCQTDTQHNKTSDSAKHVIDLLSKLTVTGCHICKFNLHTLQTFL